MPSDEMLTDDELVRLVVDRRRRLGVREVRLTGGEPLLRRGLVDIVAGIAALEPRPELSMTTNGLGLARTPRPLAEAGLDRVNVSLDTLDPERFAHDHPARPARRRRRRARRGRDGRPDAGQGQRRADARGQRPRGARRCSRWCLDRGYELRFIEQMPLDAQHGWDRDEMVTADEILARAVRGFTLDPAPEPRGSAPAELFLVDGGPATVGVIASVTGPFCGACDRIRLTADGQVRNCLFAREETDLRGPLRAGATDAELAGAGPRRCAAQAAGPRHRRPGLPAARPPDVRHRRLSRLGRRSWRVGASVERASVEPPVDPRRVASGSPAARGSAPSEPDVVGARQPAPCVGRLVAGVGLFHSRRRRWPRASGTPLALHRRGSGRCTGPRRRRGRRHARDAGLLDGARERPRLVRAGSHAASPRPVDGAGRRRWPARRRCRAGRPRRRRRSSAASRELTIASDEAHGTQSPWRSGSGAPRSAMSAPAPRSGTIGHGSGVSRLGAWGQAATLRPVRGSQRRGHLAQPRPSSSGGTPMSDRTYRVAEIVGTSPDGIDQAIRNALAPCRATLRQSTGSRSPGCAARSRTGRGALPGGAQGRLPPRGD